MYCCEEKAGFLTQIQDQWGLSVAPICRSSISKVMKFHNKFGSNIRYIETKLGQEFISMRAKKFLKKFLNQIIFEESILYEWHNKFDFVSTLVWNLMLCISIPRQHHSSVLIFLRPDCQRVLSLSIGYFDLRILQAYSCFVYSSDKLLGLF